MEHTFPISSRTEIAPSHRHLLASNHTYAGFSTKKDEMQYFEDPRYTCAQVAPELSRGNGNSVTMETKRNYMRKILEKSGAKNIDKTMKYLMDFDKSEKMGGDDNVSNKTYGKLLETRGFDIYGRLRTKKILENQKQFRQEEKIEVEENIVVPKLFGKEKIAVKNLPLRTAEWNIGEKEEFNAPVGFAKNPSKEFRSRGNEIHFSYDGGWRDGNMNGYGSYVYSDGLRFDGWFVENKADGVGIAKYGNGSYDGEWRQGKYFGYGSMKCSGGAEYKGEFLHGRRDCQGKINYGDGLYYEGEFRDGKPHGRGKMTSDLTGYSFEGNFHRGRICGSGVLVTPPPTSLRVVRMWGKEEASGNVLQNSAFDLNTSHDAKEKIDSTFADERKIAKERKQLSTYSQTGDKSADEFLLPAIVRSYLAELRNIEELEIEQEQATFGPIRTLRLNDYVTVCRQKFNLERSERRKDELFQRSKRQADLRQEIRDARMRAVRDEEILMDEEKQDNNRNFIADTLRSYGFLSSKPGDQGQVQVQEIVEEPVEAEVGLELEAEGCLRGEIVS